MRAPSARTVLAFAAVFTALVLQVSVLSRLGLPAATPPLLLVVVVAIAIAAGPTTGVIVGFSAGLLLELVPPAVGSLGQVAAVFAVVGFIAGHYPVRSERPTVATCALTAGLAGGSTIVLAVLASIFGSAVVTWSVLPVYVVTSALYAGVLAIAVIPAVSLLYKGATDSPNPSRHWA